MGSISRDARLIFILMWPHCDDAGRLRASSRALASLLLPFDDDAPSLIEGWLSELEAEHCIVRYLCDGAHYLEVTNFLKHQKIDHPSKSNIPPPRETSRELHEASRNVALDLDQGPRIGKDRIGTKDSKTRAPKKARFHKTSLPDNCPDPDHKIVARNYWDLKNRSDLGDQVDEIAGGFRDHALRDDVRHVNWDAAWRTWYCNAMKFNKKETNGHGRNGQHSAATEGAIEYLNLIAREAVVHHNGASETCDQVPAAAVDERPRMGSALPAVRGTSR